MLSAIRREIQKVTMSAMNSNIMYRGKNKHKKSRVGDEPYEMKGEIFTYRHADWNDFIALYNVGGEPLILEALADMNFTGNGFVTKNGVYKYSSNRGYFLSLHNHSKPSWYAAHANINNYLLSLGSWYTTQRVLLVSPKFDGTNYRKGMFSVTDESVYYTADRTSLIESKTVEIF